MSSTPSPSFAGLTKARPDAIGLNAAGLARLSSAMRRQIDTGRAPGLSMLISRAGKIGHMEAIGKLRPDGPTMGLDAVFRIYSMTKPIVSVALMMLIEDGRLFLSDSLAEFIPEFADVRVAVATGETIELVPPRRPITIHDLLRHTSGLTYGFTGATPVQQLYKRAPLDNPDSTCADFCRKLAKLPLKWHPGEEFEYGHSTDVVGRVIEIVSGKSLGAFLDDHILEPLGMRDTGFYTPPGKHAQLAEPFAKDPVTGAVVNLSEIRQPPKNERGGGGLASTLGDYARFCEMLRSGGSLDGVRILGRDTLNYMTSNHLDTDVRIDRDLILAPGYRFGLGFRVRMEDGVAQAPGRADEYGWGGVAGTQFWVSPRLDLFAILMIQAPEQRVHFAQLFRCLAHAAVD